MRPGWATLLLLGSVACATPGHHGPPLVPGRTAKVCVSNQEWSQAIVEVRVRASLVARLRLETAQERCITLDRVPEEVYFRVRLLAQTATYDSEPTLVSGKQEIWLEITHRPWEPRLWVVVR